MVAGFQILTLFNYVERSVQLSPMPFQLVANGVALEYLTSILRIARNKIALAEVRESVIKASATDSTVFAVLCAICRQKLLSPNGLTHAAQEFCNGLRPNANGFPIE